MGALDVSRLTMSELSPTEFARLVRDTPKPDLTELMAGDLRGQVLDEICGRMEQQFLPDRAPRRPAVVHWHVTGRPDGGHDAYELVIADGTCTLQVPPQCEPRLTITLDAVEFLKLTSGNASSTTMFFTRQLKLDGDLGLGAGLTSMFDIPTP